MEDMDVDVQVVAPGALRSDGQEVPIIIPDSGSSTEAEEEEESDDMLEEGTTIIPNWPRMASSQIISRRRVRPDRRLQYSSQTSHLNRGPMAIEFRVSASSDTEHLSGSTEEVSDTEEDGRNPESREQRPSAETVPVLNASQPAPVSAPSSQPVSATEPTVAAEVERTEPLVQPEVKTDPASATAASDAAHLTGGAESDEGEGETCSICFEPWTTSGEHRLATLRCGHLFGYTCIDRWLKGQGAKCPQCNKKAKRSDIVLLYARKLKAVDNTEQESLKRSLEQEQSLRRKAELESAQCRLKLQVVTEECGKLRQEVQELRRLMAQTAASSTKSQTSTLSMSQRESSLNGGHYVFSKAILVSQTGGCRVMCYFEPLTCLLASQPSPHSTLVPGFGVKKIAAVNMKASHYIPIHSKQIRGLSFNSQDNLLLSASFDNTIKLTSLLNNSVVQVYNTGKPVWSCCWCQDNRNYIFAGLSNGSVLVYDTRDTSTHVQLLAPLRSNCPVVSLSYLPRTASSLFPSGGLIAGSLEGGCFWEQVEGTTYRQHVLPLESGGCTDIQVEPESRHCLVTYRPSRVNPTVRCVLMEMNQSPQQDASQAPLCSCSSVQTFTAGSSCKLLTKNAVFKNPSSESSTLVCAGDEGSNSTMVWNASTGALLQKLPADLPVLDICPFEVNQEHYLASLTEKMIKIYKWEENTDRGYF